MTMLYNSDQFTVLRVDLDEGSALPEAERRGGYEIVDKLARTGIFLDGVVALQFEAQAQALAAQSDAQSPDIDALDEFIAGYAVLGGQPMVLH